jgi:hypothetical protein
LYLIIKTFYSVPNKTSNGPVRHGTKYRKNVRDSPRLSQ